MTKSPSADEIGSRLAERIAVDHVLYVRAKSEAIRLTRTGVTTGRDLVDKVALALGTKDPGVLILHPAVEFEWADLDVYVRFFSAKLAACEAIWSLLHNGILIPGNSGSMNVEQWSPSVTTGIPRNFSGSNDHILIRGHSATFPTEVLLAPSQTSEVPCSLSDGDLFLRDLEIPDLHPLVEESLREAVKCFRHDLYLPCLAMLTKGLEGAWTETGAALAAFGAKSGEDQPTSLRKSLDNPRDNVKNRIDEVTKYFGKSTCDPLRAQLPKEPSIGEIVLWSDEVRDSRNVLHFGKTAAVPITYERVAVLLLATRRHFRALYSIKHAAETST